MKIIDIHTNFSFTNYVIHFDGTFAKSCTYGNRRLAKGTVTLFFCMRRIILCKHIVKKFSLRKIVFYSEDDEDELHSHSFISTDVFVG